MKYKVGDRVTLKDFRNLPSSEIPRFFLRDKMLEHGGKRVTINRLSSPYAPIEYYGMEEVPYDWTLTMIEDDKLEML